MWAQLRLAAPLANSSGLSSARARARSLSLSHLGAQVAGARPVARWTPRPFGVRRGLRMMMMMMMMRRRRRRMRRSYWRRRSCCS